MTPLDLSAYTVISQLGMILAIVNYGLNQAWGPFVYSNAGRSDFQNLVSRNGRKVLVFVVLAGSILVLFLQEFLLLMGKEEYAIAKEAFPLFILAYLFQMLYYIHVTILIQHKNTRILPVITALAAGLCIGANLILVPEWGIYGAAAATLMGFFVMFLLSFMASRSYIRLSLLDRRFLIVLLMFMSGILCSRLFVEPLSMLFRISLKLFIAALFVKSLEWSKFMHVKEFIASLFNRVYDLK
jgi:O-antigen/teichoic acid export membrane protein